VFACDKTIVTFSTGLGTNQKKLKEYKAYDQMPLNDKHLLLNSL